VTETNSALVFAFDGMPKQRMTVLDIRASLAHIQSSIVGCRVNNVYDINAKTYLLKLQKSGTKERLVIESGVRFHTTKFTCDKGLVPSGFAMKLRKHLRHRRLDSIKQLGIDRLIDFTFVGGEESFHLILELYAAGNVILTDSNYSILTLLRVHEDTNAGGGVGQVYAVRSVFDVSFARPFLRCTLDQVEEILANSPAENAMKTIIRRTDFGPALIEHFFIEVGCDRSAACSGADARNVLEVLNRCFDLLDNGPVLAESRGFITMKNAGDEGSFEEFWPLSLHQHAGKPVKEFDKFDTACDEFFSLVESQRRVAAHEAQVKAVMSKVDKVKRDNDRRLEELRHAEQLNLTKAQLIQENVADVDAVIAVINSMLAQGMDWAQLRALVKSEQRTGNPVANLIRHLRMEQNCVTVLLSNRDEEDVSKPMIEVEIDLSLNARKNAQDYFDQRRKAVQKHEKTGAAAIKAIKGAERKAAAEIVKVKEVSAVKVERQPLWFEKFCWFITSENFLVLSGHDAQQNEILVKRYLRKGDLYVHADAHGAASTIIKANDPGTPIPPLSIAEAGAMTVFRSSAWSSKMVTSAYWVNPDQVSKSAPSGEYLSKGGFMIRGRKNFLPANQLIAGFGIMFKVHSSCTARHAGERRIRGFGDDASQLEACEAADEFSEQSSENGGSEDEHETVVDAARLTSEAVAALQCDSPNVSRSCDNASIGGGAGAASVRSESQVRAVRMICNRYIPLFK
jgi:predicted ribosome quality control (RQC) complex YloA/Tae2 family protein